VRGKKRTDTVKSWRSNFHQTTEEEMKAAEGFTSGSTKAGIIYCVLVVDGYHLQIITPSKAEAKNLRLFYSGHYQTYGLNV
jgi:hypothetical protein